MQPIQQANHALAAIMEREPLPTPDPDSIASVALDPCINRTLMSQIPLKIFDLPSQRETWESLRDMLIGMEQVYHLGICADLTTWKVWVFCVLARIRAHR